MSLRSDKHTGEHILKTLNEPFIILANGIKSNSWLKSTKQNKNTKTFLSHKSKYTINENTHIQTQSHSSKNSKIKISKQIRYCCFKRGMK